MSDASMVGLLLGPDLEELTTASGPAPSLTQVGTQSVWVAVRDASGKQAGAVSRVRDLCERGVRILLVVDVATAIRPGWVMGGGRFVAVADHLNLTSDNPLAGPNDSEWGPRFQDLTDAWDPALRATLRRTALDHGVDLREGVVAGLPGSARTAAELSMLRTLGADMASNGFVEEAIVGRHAGRRMAGLALLRSGSELSDYSSALLDLLGLLIPALEGDHVPA